MQQYYSESRQAIPEDDGRSLLAKDQFEHELWEISRLNPLEERYQADLAREGNQEAVTLLFENCLRYVYFLAIKYAHNFELDELDIVQAASVHVWAHMQEALRARNACSFLNVVARRAIFHYCIEDRLIRVPYSSYHAGRRAPLTVSLTAPLYDDNGRSLLDCLEDADWQEIKAGVEVKL